ncbi:hypothetical protein PG996_016103 [Apiospora saccharicola]|uniref:Uncharacterized protein n=1 Tax=Apiospora saccharicola TaxID=335842 RepID=A0ABR1TN48_9PEZI
MPPIKTYTRTSTGVAAPSGKKPSSTTTTTTTTSKGAPAPTKTTVCLPGAAAPGENALGVKLWAQWGATLNAWAVLVPWFFLGLWGVLKRNLLRNKEFRDWAAVNRVMDEDEFVKAEAADARAAKVQQKWASAKIAKKWAGKVVDDNKKDDDKMDEDDEDDKKKKPVVSSRRPPLLLHLHQWLWPLPAPPSPVPPSPGVFWLRPLGSGD